MKRRDSDLEAVRDFLRRGGELRLAVHDRGRLEFEDAGLDRGTGRTWPAPVVFRLVRVRGAAIVSRETPCGRFTDLVARSLPVAA
jgi:hypothetical protein